MGGFRVAILLVAVLGGLLFNEASSQGGISLTSLGPSESPIPGSDDPEACTHIRTNLKPAMIFVLILLVFSFFVELLLHRLEIVFKNREQLMKITRAIYNELMLLGLIGILIFFFNQSTLTRLLSEKMAKWGTQDPRDPSHLITCQPNQLEVLFEKVHLGIFATMGIYFLTCFWLILLHWIIYKHWIRIDFEPFDPTVYHNTLHLHLSVPWPLRYWNVKRVWKLWRMRAIDRLHALRNSCIEQYGLPQTFQFSWYFKLAMRDVVIQILDVHPVCWAILIVAFGFTLIRLSILRVDNSEKTLIIYGSLSLFVSLLTVLVLVTAARVYGKVLRLASVRRYLHIREDSSDEEEASEPLIDDPHPLINEDSTALLAQPTLDSNASPSAVPTTSTAASYLEPSSKYAARTTYGSMRYSSDSSLTQNPQERNDSAQRSFQDLSQGKHLPFHVFHRFGDTVTLMTVDEYRNVSNLVANILKRAQVQTSDDSEHKNMLFFRSRRYLVFALQVITFVQSWLLGLSIYYAWSVYQDRPTDIPKHPGLLAFIAIGPLLTYSLLALTLAKLVKATYTGGLIRSELVLATLFADSNPNS